MSTLENIRPIKKDLVMELLQQAGFDVSDWKHFRGKSPAANPKYCYNWSFEQAGELVAVCLWHRELKQEGKEITFHRRPRSQSSLSSIGAGVRKKRSQDFGDRLELAYRQQLPVRVIILDGAKKHNEKTKSVVKARSLDPLFWAVERYDFKTGECLVRRGSKPIAPIIEAADLELSWFEGKRKRAFVYHRHREGRARRRKIKEAMTNNNGRLLCDVPNCGFDFKERYGALGQGYAQVHHLQPLSNSPDKGRVLKLKDLAIVCANCHVMIHIGGKCRPLSGLISK